MIIDKIHKRAIVNVQRPDTEARLEAVQRGAKLNVSLVAWQAVQNMDFNPGDVITVDVKILVERANL